jgi:hypothetical protein
MLFLQWLQQLSQWAPRGSGSGRIYCLFAISGGFVVTFASFLECRTHTCPDPRRAMISDAAFRIHPNGLMTLRETTC